MFALRQRLRQLCPHDVTETATDGVCLYQGALGGREERIEVVGKAPHLVIMHTCEVHSTIRPAYMIPTITKEMRIGHAQRLHVVEGGDGILSRRTEDDVPGTHLTVRDRHLFQFHLRMAFGIDILLPYLFCCGIGLLIVALFDGTDDTRRLTRIIAYRLLKNLIPCQPPAHFRHGIFFFVVRENHWWGFFHGGTEDAATALLVTVSDTDKDRVPRCRDQFLADLLTLALYGRQSHLTDGIEMKILLQHRRMELPFRLGILRRETVLLHPVFVEPCRTAQCRQVLRRKVRLRFKRHH